jgi:chromosomal replication initiator protein
LTTELAVNALGQALCRRVGEPRYKLWFADKTKWIWHEDHLTVGVPNHFYLDWLKKAFADDIRAAAEDALGLAPPLRFVIEPELFQAARQQERTDTPVAAVARGPQVEDHRSEDHDQGDLASYFPQPFPARIRRADGAGTTGGGQRPPTHQRRWRRLADFVVGPCNRVAHASAQCVVEAPGQEANPLVVHGPVGTGKTHLLEGIHHGLRHARADWRVCYITAEDFTHRFVQAMRLNKLGTFRKQFRDCDAFLLDDLHFLATKPATQEEFLHTFDALHAESRQVVVSCDCHPRLIDQFLPELADRLLGGAVWSVAPPELETRLDLLRAKAARQATVLPEDVLKLLAENLRGNVRELEGALNSLQHYSRVAGSRIDLPLARQVLGDLLRHSVRLVKVDDVERAICQVLRLDHAALRSKQRGWSHSHPRMLAMFLVRKQTGASYAEIGQRFGGRNHSTVVAAEKKVRQWIKDDATLNLGDHPLRVRDVIERIERELQR